MEIPHRADGPVDPDHSRRRADRPKHLPLRERRRHPEIHEAQAEHPNERREQHELGSCDEKLSLELHYSIPENKLPTGVRLKAHVLTRPAAPPRSPRRIRDVHLREDVDVAGLCHLISKFRIVSLPRHDPRP